MADTAKVSGTHLGKNALRLRNRVGWCSRRQRGKNLLSPQYCIQIQYCSICAGSKVPCNKLRCDLILRASPNMQKTIVWLILASLAWYGYTKYQERVVRTEANSGEAASAAPPHIAAMEEKPRELPASATSSFLGNDQSTYKCDGRTHCSQMTSCAEATYFLKNCPDTKMDGNNDGIPCEKQWCK